MASCEAAIRRAGPGDVPALTALWRRSVEATHRFLGRADIEALRPEVESALGQLEVWVFETDGAPAGFMALGGDMVEALFVDPASMGAGVGTKLLAHARRIRGDEATLRVDVNEDNPDALGFYLTRGFAQTGRSELDSAGRPWPLIHLEQGPLSEPGSRW